MRLLLIVVVVKRGGGFSLLEEVFYRYDFMSIPFRFEHFFDDGSCAVCRFTLIRVERRSSFVVFPSEHRRFRLVLASLQLNMKILHDLLHLGFLHDLLSRALHRAIYFGCCVVDWLLLLGASRIAHATEIRYDGTVVLFLTLPRADVS